MKRHWLIFGLFCILAVAAYYATVRAKKEATNVNTEERHSLSKMISEMITVSNEIEYILEKREYEFKVLRVSYVEYEYADIVKNSERYDGYMLSNFYTIKLLDKEGEKYIGGKNASPNEMKLIKQLKNGNTYKYPYSFD
jgi:hypothetical protein